jgi:hypothetical protein
MRIERHKNFLSPEECSALNAWVDEGVEKKWLDVSISTEGIGYTKRVTSRLYGNRYEYPQVVLDISNRIRSFCGVNSYDLIERHGRDGVVVSCTFPGGDVYTHQDPRSYGGFATLRCNVMTRKADSGGELYLDGQRVDIETGELHCYLVSEIPHSVSTVSGKTSRVLWMFGAHVPVEDWESGKIKTGELNGK